MRRKRSRVLIAWIIFSVWIMGLGILSCTFVDEKRRVLLCCGIFLGNLESQPVHDFIFFRRNSFPFVLVGNSSRDFNLKEFRSLVSTY